ncbi:pre-mRNA-splicing factor Cwc24p [[Candida] railenensis]|uniref:Pre-mRNA-splicing factor CWC24 n=1 Tax=[Candida] railenensis TaxID=45579 RepID=A0A9P0QTD8_9ASCO|nr:pre-mRNA-splicing factor Cwc24p [[Candida] railenensis]
MFKKRTIKKDNARPNEKRKLEQADLSESVQLETTIDGDVPETPKTSNFATSQKNRLGGTGGFKKRKQLDDEKTKRRDASVHLEENEETNNNVNREEDQEASKVSVSKPLKAIPVSINRTTVTDFQPDVCKDFLQTGYCGYGDTCKFLHVRDESRQKRAINKEWESVGGKASQKSISEVEVSGDGSRGSPHPFRCVLCKSDYKSPVITSCGHLFCQKCFLDRVKKKHACFICGKDTLGVCKPVSKAELAKLLES